MSDEKNSGNTFNINAVPSCIDEPVKAVLTPVLIRLELFLEIFLQWQQAKSIFQQKR